MEPERGRALTILAALFAILAITNFAKFLPVTSDTGFVLFGTRLAGAANVVAGLIAGVVVGTYAFGIWGMRRWALPMSWCYAAYVIANGILFRLTYPIPAELGGKIFEIGYSIVATGTAVGTAMLLSQRKAELR